jgi:ribose transport system ATP-binding protein
MPLKYENIVEMKNITKEFPGVKALTDVDLDVRKGEVHALVGENGAGKSTIIKILMGVYTKTSGQIFIEGEKVDFKSPLQAQRYGLGAVYQDVNLAQHLSVAENFFMGKLPKTKLGFVDYKYMCDETKKVLDSIEVYVNPKSIIKTLSVAQQEMVSIGKILHQKSKIVIFDEPTALLTNDETEQLFRIIKLLKEKDVGILYISHRLEEIFQVCDRVTVLKDGFKVDTLDVNDTNEDDLINMMVGRSVENMYEIERIVPGDIVLGVKNLSSGKTFQDINFNVKKGEIFGMYGLVGSGRTEIVRSIFGADSKESGTITVKGQEVDFKSPKDAINAGIALLPENRKDEGLALILSVSTNINMASIENISSKGIIDNKKGYKVAGDFIDILKTRTPSIHQRVQNLSGGNQQKVVISKWLAKGSDIFIFDEPTVGVDVGAKREIYKIFEELIKQEKAIIVISSYLPEVMGLTDRMLIMHEGKQMAILDKSEFSEEYILKLASGFK